MGHRFGCVARQECANSCTGSNRCIQEKVVALAALIRIYRPTSTHDAAIVNFLQSTVTVHMLPRFINKEKLLDHRVIGAQRVRGPARRPQAMPAAPRAHADTAVMTAAAGERHTGNT